jgi:hypothetical protein
MTLGAANAAGALVAVGSPVCASMPNRTRVFPLLLLT